MAEPVALIDAAKDALECLQDGFIACYNCGYETPTHGVDAVWRLREALDCPTPAPDVADHLPTSNAVDVSETGNMSDKVAGLVAGMNACPDIANARIVAPADRVPEVVMPTAMRDQAATALTTLSAENAALVADVERLRGAVQEAERVFRWYGDLHAAKPDAEKAKRNYDLADQMRQALGGRHG